MGNPNNNILPSGRLKRIHKNGDDLGMVYGMEFPITQVYYGCILSKTALKWMDDITVNRPVINRGNEQSFDDFPSELNFHLNDILHCHVVSFLLVTSMTRKHWIDIEWIFWRTFDTQDHSSFLTRHLSPYKVRK